MPFTLLWERGSSRCPKTPETNSGDVISSAVSRNPNFGLRSSDAIGPERLVIAKVQICDVTRR